MHNTQRFLIIFCLAYFFLLAFAGNAFTAPLQDKPPVTEKLSVVLDRTTPVLQKELINKNLMIGSPIFIRIFKLSSELEVWVGNNGRYELFKTYPICDYSGFPGPKIKEGDWQSPEGFYAVTAEKMNPLSSYHLSFDIGYPNEYDRLHNRNGGNIMVHGSCSSMGCFAMSNYRIEEIYTLVHSALNSGQEKVDVHVFPFRMTSENMMKFRSSPWWNFWRNLKEGFDEFERSRQVPKIQVAEDRYIVTGSSKLAMHTGTK